VAVRFLEEAVPDLHRLEGPFVEIGIGPLGVGCIHFIPAVERERKLIGVDPLPRIEYRDYPHPIQSFIAACERNYTQVQAMGENTGLPGKSFSLAVCYNVLDHTESPESILKEIARILKSGRYLLLGCDVLSLLSLIRHRILKIHDAAHPHKLFSKALERLVIESGLKILAVNYRPDELLRQFCGKGFRRLIVAQKL